MTPSDTAESLAGVGVVTVSRGFSAAALCGRLLADLGATVTRVDLPGPTGAEADLVAMLDRGTAIRRVCTVDDLDPAGGCDVVVTDAAGHEALRGAGLADPATWWAANPRLVGATVTAYGLDQPADVPDLVLQAEAGITATTGYPGAPPTRAGVSLGVHASGFLACAAILAGLHQADRTGRGSWLDGATLDALAMMLGNALPGHVTNRSTDRDSARAGNAQPLSAPWNSYPARDGDVVIVAIGDARWRDLLRVIGRPDLVAEARYADKTGRVRHRAEVDALIAGWTRERATSDIVATLRRSRIAASAVHEPDEARWHPLAAERGLVVGTASGAPALGSVLRLTGSPVTAPVGPGPAASTTDDRPDGERAEAERRPLAGLRVVELGGHTAAALCTRLLADLGADVIKVELPRGDDARFTVPVLSDGSSFLWHSWNLGKRSVVLDLAHPDGAAVLADLLTTSDAFVENLAADTLRSLGLDPDTVRAAHPHLVYCAISGFGATGAERDRRAYDTVLQAFAGLMAVTGFPEHRPVKIGPSLVDNVSALCAAVAVLGGLHRRRRTGTGCVADVALLDVAYWLMAEWWPRLDNAPAAATGPGRRVGNRHPDRPLENSYRCADGVEIAVSAPLPDLLDAATAMFGDPGDGDGGWDAAAAARAADLDSTEFLARCRYHGIPASRHHGVGSVAEHPVVRRRRMLAPLRVPGGDECVVFGSPFAWHDGRRAGPTRWHAPGLGEHTDEVLTTVLRLPADRLARLRDAGITTARDRTTAKPRDPEREGARP